MTLSTEQIQNISYLVNSITGIQWSAEKSYLMETRLADRLADYGCSSVDELLTRVRQGDAQLRKAFIDAVTTRETLFFRDRSPFIALEHKALPELIDNRCQSFRPKRLRIWSAACSSGQEPYSIAMTLMRMLPDFDSWNIQIIATDISDAAIQTASRGFYSDFEMDRGIPEADRNQFFERQPGGWRIKDSVRSLVTYSRRNLLEPLAGLGPFDVVFCRNVAIYFDLPVKRDLFERISAVMEKDACLFVGCGESLADFGPRWAPEFHCGSVFYRPNQPRASFSLQPKAIASPALSR